MRLGTGPSRKQTASLLWGLEALRQIIEAERASWRQLEDALNADLRTARREKVSWVITGLAFGVIAGALVQ